MALEEEGNFDNALLSEEKPLTGIRGENQAKKETIRHK
jgi:hypothetical protein